MQTVKAIPAEGPKFAMPLSYIFMDANTRDYLSHIVPVHLSTAMLRHVYDSAVIVERAHYVDCARCRERRIEYAKREPHYFDAEKRKDETRHQHSTRECWCNNCQGTGWVSEAPALSQKRHQYVTAEMRLQRMPIPELEAEVTKGVKSTYSRDLLSRVLLARLKDATTPLSQRV